MIVKIGDMFSSKCTTIVNTINCVGVMGKGIALEFKKRYPDMYTQYVKKCNSGEVKPGAPYLYDNGDIKIINFPTKDKWREKSRMEYIEDGLDALVLLIKELNIKSIAIPPLGSGNGGLIWNDVKQVLAKKLEDIAKQVAIYIYEPSRNFATTPTQEPKLSTSALVLMELKGHLKKFNSLRLQKAAYFMDLFSSKKYFRFVPHKYGPYDHSIDIVSKGIREFQQFHGTSSTKEAEKILFNKLTSESVNNTLQALLPWIIKSCDFVNSIETDHEKNGKT